MKIIVFGATGRTGKEIVRQALEQGHTVTAFVRDPVPLTPPSGLPMGLRLFKGNIFDPVAVSEAIDGHRAVLSALGGRTLKKENVLARAIPNILAGMDARYVQRIIALGAAGALYPAGKYQTGWFNLVLATAKSTFLRQPFADQAIQERLLEQSGMDFTIVRPPRLNDKAESQEVRVLPDGLPGGGWQIARADVADFMLLQLTDPRFHRQGVYISY
jgi:putative NADH-flavin reductase